MVTVKMPRADWENTLMILDSYNQLAESPVIDILIAEISNQVDEQEY